MLVAVNPSGAKGLLDRALDLVRSPVDALESDYQLRKAEEALDRQWRRQRTYLLTPAQLAELEPDVEWGEKVEVDVCRDGRAVALVARTVDGVVTLLMIQGRNHGDAQGEHACPAGDSGLAPWTE